MNAIKEVFKTKKHHKRRRKLKDYFYYAKDGVITGSADTDPAGIVTYTQVGALTGFSQLWLLFFTIPMLIVVEEMSARVGVVTKKGLNKVILDKYGKKVALFAMMVVLVSNVATLGADLAGMASVIGLFVNINWIYILLFLGLGFTFFLLRESYSKISRFLFILTPVFLVYIVATLLEQPEWGEVLKQTLIPQIDMSVKYLMSAVALLGTTISAYLLFWQTEEEVEDHKTVSELADEKRGVRLGMVWGNIIFYFVVIAGAATLFGNVGDVTSWGPETAASALRSLGGYLPYVLFTVGIVGSGLIAIPVLAMTTGYVVSDTMGWKDKDKIHKAKGFYVVMAASIVMGMALSLIGIKPMAMLYYSQVLQGILTPILLVFLLRITASEKIMGKYINGKWTNIIGWATVVIMVTFSVFLLFELLI
jgi:Mn2+/Fe2+ NRAMP family transporter